MRYDHYSTVGGSLNPRLALVWNPLEATALKLLYGTAFRAPNVFEFYGAGLDDKPNPGLKPERIVTYEFVVEHRLQPNLRIIGDVYYNRLSNLINQVTDPEDGLNVFENVGHADVRGAEIEIERSWQSGARARASHSWQLARDRDSGEQLSDSPRHLSKLNAMTPIFGRSLRAAGEAQYIGARKTLSGGTTGGAVIANVTLSSEELLPGLGLSLSIYNLFDKRHADPARPEHVQDVIQQDGRSIRFSVSYRLKGP
jgi:outer membrane receptor protein involved in Fe transport